MALLDEKSVFDDVFRLENDTPAEAISPEGDISFANIQAQALANRTRFLKGKTEAHAAALASTVNQSITFTAGGTLNSALDRISDGTYLYYWTGTYPKTVSAGSTVDTDGGIGIGLWGCDTDLPFRQNLRSGEEGFGDAIVQHNQNFSVRDVLKRIRTLADNNAPLPYLGYDPTNDAELYDEMGLAADRKLLLHGSLHIAGRCGNGIRRNAGLFSVRAGQPVPGQGFNVPLMGVATAQELRAYDIYESVPFYLDNTSPERQSYHNVASANYTATTAQIDPVIYATTLAKLEVGYYIRTMHAPYCIGLVQAVDAVSGIITVDMWADSKTSTTTPASGVGLYTEYITKIYVANLNLFITENSDITNATGIEMGMSSKKAVTGSIVGYDTVTLPNSTQNITAAYFARSSNLNGFGFTYGFRAQDSQINFHSASTELYGRTPRIGFSENSDAIVGSRFGTKNIYSMLWSSSDDLTDVSLANSTMAIGPNGQNYRKFNRTLIISADVTLGGWHPHIWATATGISFTMPPAGSHLVGHEFSLFILSPGEYWIKGNNGDALVNGQSSYKVTTTVARKMISVEFDGSQWQVWGQF